MKVLLVDDDPLILHALQSVVRAMGEDVTVIGVDQPADAHKLLQRESGFDLMLLNLVLQDGDGFQVLELMRQRHPGVPVVAMSNHEDGADVVRVIDMGAMGFVPKRSPKVDVRSALAMVMVGGVFIPPGMLGLERVGRPFDAGDTVPAVMRPSSQAGASAEAPAEDKSHAATAASQSDKQPAAATDIELPVPTKAPPAPADRRKPGSASPAAAPGKTSGAPATTSAAPAPLHESLPRLPQNIDSLGLTPRQTEVLALILRGLPNKLIARELGLSVDTVKDHVAAVLRVLGVTTRTQAVLAVSQITMAQNLPGWRAPDR